MSDFNFKLPDIGEGIAEAEILAWHVKVGDVVEEDMPLADLMTDKATVEISAPVSGRILKLNGDVGEQIAIGSIFVVFETDAAANASEANEADAPPLAIDGLAGENDTVSVQPVVAVQHDGLSDAPWQAAELVDDHGRTHASPAVRARARDLAIDLANVKPAQDGRIRHADLDAFISYNAHSGYRMPLAKRADEQVRVIGMRRRIADNMTASKRAIPHFTYVEEIDVTKLEVLRTDLNATRGDRPKLTMLPLLIVAICRSVPQFPMINARYDDDALVVTRSGAVHLGIATQTDAGLMVPVLRDAQDQNVWQLASEISRLANAARRGKATSQELSNSTLTITSLGPLGGIATTPVINRPEVAIIGPNKIVERPIFRDGVVVAAKLMNLSISCDHRVVDGWDAASFVQAVKRLVETPALLFVD